MLIAPAGEIYPLCGDVLRRRASKSGASIKQFFSTFFGFNKTEISSNGSSVILVTHDVIVKHLFCVIFSIIMFFVLQHVASTCGGVRCLALSIALRSGAGSDINVALGLYSNSLIFRRKTIIHRNISNKVK